MSVGAALAVTNAHPPLRTGKLQKRASSAWIGCIVTVLLRCSPSTPPESAADIRHQPVSFSFSVPGEEKPIASTGLRGRATVVLLMATYDLASQVMASRIGELLRGTKRRANAVAVAMEPPSYAHLISAYRDTLKLPYPVAIADFATLQGEGPFGRIERVPVTIFLNPQGIETQRLFGEQSIRTLEDALRRAQESELR